MFLFLEKWPSVGDVLCVPAVYSSLVTQWPVPAGPRVGSDLFAGSVPQAVGLCISCFWCLPPGG